MIFAIFLTAMVGSGSEFLSSIRIQPDIPTDPYPQPMLRSRSVFDGSGSDFGSGFFSPAPAPAPSKSTVRFNHWKKKFLNTPPSLLVLEKNSFILNYLFFWLAFNQCWNERREHQSKFLLFYLRWSRTFRPAPAPKCPGSAILSATLKFQLHVYHTLPHLSVSGILC